MDEDDDADSLMRAVAAAAPKAPPPRFKAPRVAGYIVGERLGSGGFGEVYAARREVIDRECAIKVLHAQYSADAGAVARFIAEARAVNKISHPAIVEIFDFGVLDDGRHYCVMELIRGQTLRELLRRRTRLPLDEAVPILRGIAEAVDAAHAAGIAHRDLKPDNVFVLDGGTIKLIDFGLAKLTTDKDTPPITVTGSVFGTPLYMSPEQCRGQGVTLATDAYSFGVLAYHVLTGTTPFTGEPLELALHHLNDLPEPPSKQWAELDERVDRVIAALLAKDPTERPLPLVPVIDALVGEASLPPRPRAARSKLLWIGAPLAILAVAGGTLWMVSRTDQRSAAAAPGCPSGVERLAGVWDPMLKAVVTTRFAVSDKQFVRDFGKVAYDLTDKVAADLRAGQDAYCREAATADPLLHAQRGDCLDERLRQLQLESRAWLREDVSKLALVVADRLVNVSECQNDRIVRAQLSPLRDPAARAAEAAALSELDTATSTANPGDDAKRLADLEATIDAAIKKLEAIKAPSTLRAKLERAAFVRFKRREFERGTGLIEAVTSEAERSRDDNVLADALHLQIDGHLQEATDEGRLAYQPDLIAKLLDRAAVAVERAGDRPHFVDRLMRARAAHASQIGKVEDASRIADEIIAFVEKSFGLNSPEIVSARLLRGLYAERVGDTKRALEEAQRAKDIRATIVGPRHPATLNDNYLGALQQNGRLDDAVEFARARLPFYAEAYGSTSRTMLSGLDWLGHILGVAGRLDEAIATYEDLIARFEPLMPNDPMFGWQHFKLAQSLIQRGRVMEALEHLLRSEDIHTKTLGADHSENVRGPRTMLPDVLYHLGQFDEARRRIADLDAMFAQNKLDPKMRAMLDEQLVPLRVMLAARAGNYAGERTLRAKLAACAVPECRFGWLLPLGDLALLRGRYREAAEMYQPLVDHFQSLLPREPGNMRTRAFLYGTTTRLAESKLLAGDAQTARKLLEEIELGVADFAGDVTSAEGRFTLARALLMTGGDRVRALELGRTAVTEFKAFGEGKAAQVREIERWLAAHAK